MSGGEAFMRSFLALAGPALRERALGKRQEKRDAALQQRQQQRQQQKQQQQQQKLQDLGSLYKTLDPRFAENGQFGQLAPDQIGQGVKAGLFDKLFEQQEERASQERLTALANDPNTPDIIKQALQYQMAGVNGAEDLLQLPQRVESQEQLAAQRLAAADLSRSRQREIEELLGLKKADRRASISQKRASAGASSARRQKTLSEVGVQAAKSGMSASSTNRSGLTDEQILERFIKANKGFNPGG